MAVRMALLLAAAAATLASTAMATITCPDTEYYCDDGTTCCKLASGGYGCCPLPNATCCEDKLHCCPQDTQCDIERSSCVKKSEGEVETLRPWLSKVSALPSKPLAMTRARLDCGDTHVTCPGSTVCCPALNTCCPHSTNGYACCGTSNAVCCDDDRCCFPGYVCSASKCELAPELFWLK